MNEWLWLGVIFTSVALVTFTLLYWAARRREKVAERLAVAEGDSAVDSHPELVLGELTPALAMQSPMTPGDRAALAQELREAGFYRPTALMEYAAIRAVLVILPLMVALGLALLADRDRMPAILIGGAIVAVLGYSLPRLYIGYVARRRARDIERGLPVAIDLLTLGLSGGQNILAALARVSHEMRHSFPVLSDELQIVLRQAELRNLPHALQQFAGRVGVPEVRNLSLILSQAERLGTDIASALLEFSTSLRTSLRQRADAQANRASFWMLFPTVLCLWVPAAIILVGPVFFEFAERRRETARLLETNRDAIGTANPFTAPGGMGAPAPSNGNGSGGTAP
jgi:tight adherence protein C